MTTIELPSDMPVLEDDSGLGGNLSGKTFADAISLYGESVKAKLNNVAIGGAPEDQLRAPLETLVRDLAEIGGLPAKSVQLVGETTLAHLQTRPDYAVTVNNALVGFIEVKAPGKSFDPRRFSDPHDKDIGLADDTTAEDS